jgi:hypothetical protein
MVSIPIFLDVNDGYPLPLIKGALMSGSAGYGTGKPETFLLDGHNNPGFSGGLLSFNQQGIRMQSSELWVS